MKTSSSLISRECEFLGHCQLSRISRSESVIKNDRLVRLLRTLRLLRVPREASAMTCPGLNKVGRPCNPLKGGDSGPLGPETGRLINSHPDVPSAPAHSACGIWANIDTQTTWAVCPQTKDLRILLPKSGSVSASYYTCTSH